MKSTLWPHTRDPYEIFQLLLENPRIPRTDIARYFHVNPKTADSWWNTAIENRIIIPPVLRRRSFSNFKEYFYFVKTEDPHDLYETYQRGQDISYYSVETGFANFFMISKCPQDLKGDVVLGGVRSDYCVSVPPNRSFDTAISKIHQKIDNVDALVGAPSPLVWHNCTYEPWDEKDEAIYNAICNDMRKPFAEIMRATDTYSDKVMKWFRRRDEFGQTFVMYFPRGESSYLLARYCIDTEYDSALISLFSELPTPCVSYRLDGKLIMSVYLSFLLEERFMARKILSLLKKEELVSEYTNSIVEYGFRPG